jgi:isopenicillin N synthase-like dioxygenase
MRHLLKNVIGLLALALTTVCQASEKIEILELDVISYEKFIQKDPEALEVLKKALYEKGIVGIRGIPGYQEKVQNYIETARKFSALPEEIKAAYAPNHEIESTFLGYERGAVEKFMRPDGSWVVEDLKVSYYAWVPDQVDNKWPREMDLKTAFQDLGLLMSQTGEAVMQAVELSGPRTGIYLDGFPRLGRMLYYRKNSESSAPDNPYWCGNHFDHSVMTTLIPAFYFVDGKEIPEPEEAGLFVKTNAEGIYRKVIANPDVMMFQVGEFGQLATNDEIRATEHRVHKAKGNVERFTMALFAVAPDDVVIHSTSVLTKDARYGGGPGDPCSYQHWSEESYKRYLVKD